MFISQGDGLFNIALHIIELVVACFVIFVAVGAFYRLTFHPLAKYPGPFLAKLTDVHLAYHAWKGDRHLHFYRCHEKYGQFVRIGPNTLSVNSETALKTIYGFKANVRKSDFYNAFAVNPRARNTHSTINKLAHARKRRILSHGFADNAIKSMEKYIVWEINEFCRAILDRVTGTTRHPYPSEASAGWSSAKNMAQLCDWLAFDIMGNLVFGKAFGMLERPDNRFAADLVSSAAHRHLICGTHLSIHKHHLDTLLLGDIAKGRARYMQFSRSQAMERTKQGLETDRKDFFYYLLNAKDPETGRGFSTDELWGESNLLIIAGSDTTSTAMAATFFYLAHNEAALRKCVKQVRETFGDVEEIVNGAKLNSCNYLRACIDEAMRMSPPVGGGLPRTVLQGGITIDGRFVPEGIDVCVPHYTLHHNEGCYPDPFSYIPERWLPDQTPMYLAGYVEKAQAAFCAFSIGPRGCIGRGLTYVELMTTLARCLWLYDIRLAPGEHSGEGRQDEREWGRQRTSEYQLRDTFTSAKDGPYLQFRSVVRE